jgi:hypothetical protein
MDKNQVAFKTSVGLATIRDSSQDILPRPLRMLLIMIDGKASLHRYERLLSKYSGTAQFGSVENMMEALYELGMINFRESTTHYSINQKTNTVKGYQPDNNNTPPLNAISSSPLLSTPTRTHSDLQNHTQTINTKSAVEAVDEGKRDIITMIEAINPPDCWELILNVESVNTPSQALNVFKVVWPRLKGRVTKEQHQLFIKHSNLLKSLAVS